MRAVLINRRVSVEIPVYDEHQVNPIRFWRRNDGLCSLFVYD